MNAAVAPVKPMKPLHPVLDIVELSISLPPGADRALAVEGATLRVLPGQTLCVVGESGSGKSMIANAVMGLLPRPHVTPVAGSILFDGRDLLQLAEPQMRELRGRRIGMVFQEPMTALNPVMRIGEQIGEVFDAHGTVPAAEKRRRILAALADMGLPAPDLLIDSYPFRLSGGQRQRVMIACALVLEPMLLIADEPTTALDVTTQAQILALIRALQQRRSTAVLFITHDFGVVSEIADHVVVMQTGRVVESGSAAQVLGAPQHPYTRKLIAAIPDGRAQTMPHDDRTRLLQVQDLCKTYRSSGGLFKRGYAVQAAKDISFELHRGETLGLVGESGSGKSSVGRCLVGLAPFDSGRIIFKGRNLAQGRNFRRAVAGKIQMVFQDPYASLNPRHRVGAAIAGGPIAQGVGKAEAMERAMKMLQLVGLGADAAQRYPHEFSGGQRQRIGIARALAMQPELLVADEPVSALDMSVQAQVLELFAQVRKEFRLAMVFITHDLRVAAQMCDRIAVMQRGEVVEYGATHKVLSDPQHACTRKLIDAVPRLAPQAGMFNATQTNGDNPMNAATPDTAVQSAHAQRAAHDIENHLHPFTNLAAHPQVGPFVIARGDGIYVEDDQGRRYLEAMSGLWCASLGFSNARLARAGSQALYTLPSYHTFNHRSNAAVIALAEKLLSLAPAPMSKVFFANSGSEANDTAVKLVWYYHNAIGKPGKKKIIARRNAYHGVTVAAGSLSGLAPNHRDFDLPIDRILHVDCPHHYRHAKPGESEEAFATRLADALEQRILTEGPDTVGAFIAEPVMGAGGVLVPPATYFEKVQAVLRKYAVLLIADEVICGFCRTGEMFGSTTFGLRPDILTAAKALSSGYVPISAVMVSGQVHAAVAANSGKIGTFGHGFTYSGHPVTTAVALETLRIYEDEQVLAHVQAVAPQFQAGLRRHANHPHVGEVRGVGLMGALELAADPATRTPFDPAMKAGARLAEFALQEGLIVRAMGDAVAFCPPLIITPAQIDEMFERFGRAMVRFEASLA